MALEAAVRGCAPRDRPVEVLEAGCGRRWPLQLPGLQLHITGVDADPAALRHRLEEEGDLDVGVVGDLRTVELAAGAYDVVYCSYVLEHVDGAAAVLDRLVAATRPGGRVLLRVPDGSSVYGFVVRHTPHLLPVLHKRYVEGFPDAGTPGHAPYPTVYDPLVRLEELRDYARAHGLTVVEEHGIDAYLDTLGRLAPLGRTAVRVLALASRGRLAATHNDIGMVLERPLAGRPTASR